MKTAGSAPTSGGHESSIILFVRPKRRLIEKFRQQDSWTTLKAESLEELSDELANLPTELESEEEEAKRFDLLILRLQIGSSRKKIVA